MDLSKFEYQRAEFVKAFKIVAFVPTVNQGLSNYLLLNSGMPNMPFAIAAPITATPDVVGKYYIMHDDGDHEIMDKVTFELLYILRR